MDARNELWNALKTIFWEEYISERKTTEAGKAVLVTVNNELLRIEESESQPPTYNHICHMLNYFYRTRGERTDKEVKTGSYAKMYKLTVKAWFEKSPQTNSAGVLNARSKRILNATLLCDDNTLFNLTETGI